MDVSTEAHKQCYSQNYPHSYEELIINKKGINSFVYNALTIISSKNNPEMNGATFHQYFEQYYYSHPF